MKIREIQELLADYGVELLTLEEAHAPEDEDKKLTELYAKQLSRAIYKAGLEAIGETPYIPRNMTKGQRERLEHDHAIRTRQREKWKQLCGIEGESDG